MGESSPAALTSTPHPTPVRGRGGERTEGWAGEVVRGGASGDERMEGGERREQERESVTSFLSCRQRDAQRHASGWAGRNREGGIERREHGRARGRTALGGGDRRDLDAGLESRIIPGSGSRQPAQHWGRQPSDGRGLLSRSGSPQRVV